MTDIAGQSTDVHFSSLIAQRPHRSNTSCIFLRIRCDLIKLNLFATSPAALCRLLWQRAANRYLFVVTCEKLQVLPCYHLLPPLPPLPLFLILILKTPYIYKWGF
ncbi:hypothetical protein [Serratia ureilytica]|uniref:hypothetical protein n=1 Tax=Serratia ureilytica TaxID=300181 RepID=UPI001427AD73|nr:hypothetical protein [Serratia ureilytica]